MIRDAIAIVVLALGIVAAASSAKAQPSPTAGSIERTIPKPASDARPTATVQGLTAARESVAPVEARFVLGAVTIEGATMFSMETLARDFEPFLATEIDGNDLRTIARRITERYHRAGYFLSYAMIPVQNVRSGIVRIMVIEGRISGVAVDGGGTDRSAIERIATRAASAGPADIARLERALGLIRDLPGVTLSDVALAPQIDPTSHILKLTISRDAVKSLIYADNRGVANDGRVRLFSSTSKSSLAISGDELRVDLFAIPSSRYRFLYGQAAASVPIGHDGLRIGVALSAGDLKQKDDGHRIDGVSTNLSARMSYPVVRGRRLTLIGKVLVNDLRSVTENDDVRFQRDRLRVLRGGVELATETRTRLLADLAVSHGLAVDGRTRAGDPLASRPGAGGQFTKFAVAAQLTHPLSDRWTLALTAAGQLADRPLLQIERFSLGGNRIGRGYDFDALTGDRGIGGGIELSRKLGDLGSAVRQVSVHGFADGGLVNDAAGSTGARGSRGLASAGLGARFSIGGFSVIAETGVPLVQRNGKSSPRALLTLFRTF